MSSNALVSSLFTNPPQIHSKQQVGRVVAIKIKNHQIHAQAQADHEGFCSFILFCDFPFVIII